MAKPEDFIEIREIDADLTKRMKTKKYGVFNKRSGYLLAVIKWYPHWRQYCFYPTDETIFNTDCLQQITDFCKNKNQEHKQTNRHA